MPAPPGIAAASAGRARIHKLAVLAVLALLAGCGGRSEEPAPTGPSLRVEVAPDSAGLGDPVRVTVTAVVPNGSEIDFPGGADSIGAWRILAADEPQVRKRGSWTQWERSFTVAGYRLGLIGPDTLRLAARTASGDTLRLRYAPRALQVGGVLKPGDAVDATKARDIQDVVATGPRLWPWIAGAGIVAALGGFLLARWLQARKRAAQPALPPPGPTPEQEFEDAIARLLAGRLLEQGLVREFYYEISRAVRLYLERVHGLPLLESTSSEVLDLLGARMRNEEEATRLREWLAEGDLVKYAKLDRLQAEAMSYLDRSRGLVRLFARPAVLGVSTAAAAAGGGRP